MTGVQTCALPIYNILNLKKLYVNEIERFKHYLSYVLIEDNVALVCVPSHTPNKKGAVHFIIESLCSERELVNASSCLQRTREIQKLAGGGSRSLEIHLGSISLINSHLLENRDILLIDDVSTSGNSLLACKQIIIRNTKNIKSITCFVFAKTV